MKNFIDYVLEKKSRHQDYLKYFEINKKHFFTFHPSVFRFYAMDKRMRVNEFAIAEFGKEFGPKLHLTMILSRMEYRRIFEDLHEDQVDILRQTRNAKDAPTLDAQFKAACKALENDSFINLKPLSEVMNKYTELFNKYDLLNKKGEEKSIRDEVREWMSLYSVELDNIITPCEEILAKELAPILSGTPKTDDTAGKGRRMGDLS